MLRNKIFPHWVRKRKVCEAHPGKLCRKLNKNISELFQLTEIIYLNNKRCVCVCLLTNGHGLAVTYAKKQRKRKNPLMLKTFCLAAHLLWSISAGRLN